MNITIYLLFELISEDDGGREELVDWAITKEQVDQIKYERYSNNDYYKAHILPQIRIQELPLCIYLQNESLKISRGQDIQLQSLKENVIEKRIPCDF